MTVARTPLRKKYSVSSPKWIGPFWGTKKLCFSKHRIREGPWRLREGLREGKTWFCKTPASWRSVKVPWRKPWRVLCDLQIHQCFWLQIGIQWFCYEKYDYAWEVIKLFEWNRVQIIAPFVFECRHCTMLIRNPCIFIVNITVWAIVAYYN